MDTDAAPHNFGRVLLADDNRQMIDITMRQIAGRYEIVGAVANGRELVESAMEHEPDFGIVDISMPEMCGIDAVREIRARGSNMKVVFLTAIEDPDYVEAAFDAGAYGYVVKKHMASDLMEALSLAAKGLRFLSKCCQLPAEAKGQF